MGVLDCVRFDHKFYLSLMIWILILIIVVSGVFMNVRHISASVTLLYFRALPEEVAVFIEWETATEIDSAGFYISRSTSQDGNYERIGSFIPAKGDSVVGAYYEYRDSAVETGVTYYYILESWDYDNTVNYSDPVSATPGSTAQTATVMVTLTSTQTLSPTPGVSPSPTLTLASEYTNTPTETSTPTNTQVPNPTATPYPTNTPTSHVPDTPTPLPTATSVEVLTVTPSATFVPVP